MGTAATISSPRCRAASAPPATRTCAATFTQSGPHRQVESRQRRGRRDLGRAYADRTATGIRHPRGLHVTLVSRGTPGAPVLAHLCRMDIMLTWLVVGLIAGALASFVSRGTGY